MIEAYFDIHNLVRIKVQTNDVCKINGVLTYLREFKKNHISEKNVDIVLSDYSQRPNLKKYYVITKYSTPILFADNYLDSPHERFCFNIVDRPIKVYYQESCPLPLTFLVELILLEKSYTLIHAAALEYDNRGYVFPAFPGIGKTTLISGFLEHGAKLLGDDMVIINKENVLSFPIDFAIYPYHLDVFEIKSKKAIKKLKKIRLLQGLYNSRFGKLNFNVVKYFLKSSGFSGAEVKKMFELINCSHARVPASEIFGKDNIVKKAQISKILYLFRQDGLSTEITMENANSAEIAEICANIMAHEWSRSIPILSIYSGLSEFSIFSLFDEIKNLFESIFTWNKCYKLGISVSLSNIDIKNQIFKFAKENFLHNQEI